MATTERNPYSQELQRRHATVMYADISGFTALSEKLDPEEVTSVMNGCFARLESIVFAHGGIVDEYLGDCVKAVFGFSPGTTLPTLHAVQAALELRDAVYEYNRETQLPSPLDIHIGVNSGLVIGLVLDDGAEGDFCVLGDTVRLAGRLEDVSDKGQIFVGPGTFAATHEEFDYRPREPVLLRPFPEPFPVYELLARKTVRRVRRDSERRQATVVFAELIGLDALSAQLDAITLSQVMNDLFAALAAAVSDCGGSVDKFLGEGIMALFGLPNAIENAPRQGVNGAIEIRKRVARFVQDRNLSTPLSVHIGVNTGLCVAGDIGGHVKRDFTVMGDTVNMAARLKEAAQPGAIYVGSETERYTRTDFEFLPLEPMVLKGKAQPVPAFELLSSETQIHRTSAARVDRMVFSPMVGRATELTHFSDLLEKLAHGSGGIVSLIGEAGLGKSRLLSEVLKLAEQLRLPVYLGRSLAIGRGQSFHPFVDLLRHWASITDDATDTQALAKLQSALQGVLGHASNEAFPFITRLMGLRASGVHADRLAGIEGEALEKLIFKSTRELFLAIARSRPTVLVFEDLHWADRSSLNLLDSLLPLCGEAPLLFVNVFRPLFEDTSDRVLRTCNERFATQHVEMRLEKLQDVDANQLVRNLLNIDDLPVALRGMIASKAEGNPFYIEEVVRSLIDQGAVEHTDGKFRVTAKINTVIIPGTIHDVIMSRVDRLDESARRLLQTAAVVGRHFYHRIIAHIIETEHPIDADLLLLKEKQIIEESGNRWEVAVGEHSLSEDLEYMFKHALAQEAVYESVLLKTRKDLHRQVAETIETLFRDRLSEFYATLAYHYTRSEQLEPAENYLCRAGEEAVRAAASSEALQFFSEATTIYDKLHGAKGGDTKHRAFLEKNVGLALLNTGQHTESIGHFDEALELLGEPVATNPLTLAVRWAVDMAAVLYRVYVHEGRRGEVPNLDHEREVLRLYFERGHAEVTSDPQRLFFQTATPLRRFHRVDPHLIDQACAMYVSCAMIFAYSGLSFAIAERMLQIAAGLLREGSINDALVYRNMLFTYHYLRGNWQDTPTIEPEVIEEALRHGMVWDVCLYVGLDMDRHLRRGNFAAARAQLAKLADIRDTYGYEYAASNHNGMHAILLLEERKLDAALAWAEPHYRYSSQRHEGAIVLMTLGILAKTRMLLGDRNGAASALREAVVVTKRDRVMSPWHQSIHQVAQLLFDVTTIEAAMANGDRSAMGRLRRSAVRSSRQALATARKVAKERIETYNLTARLWWALGKRARALQWWTTTLTEAERMGVGAELARACLDIGRRIGDSELNGMKGSAYLERAHRMFIELDLQWDLQHFDNSVEPTSTEAEPTAEVA